VVAEVKFVPNVLRFSPNGRWLLGFSRAVLSYHPEMTLTDMSTVEKPVKTHILETWLGKNGGFEARAALISPDSRWLLTSIYEGSTTLTTMLWDLTAPDPTKTRKLLREAAPLADAAFSPDSRRFSTGGQLWDLGTPEPTVVRIPVIGAGVNPKVESVTFSRDRHWLIVGVDNRLSLHTLRIDELIATARASAARELTARERLEYLPAKTAPATRP
jgi:WD40 repeat protein